MSYQPKVQSSQKKDLQQAKKGFAFGVNSPLSQALPEQPDCGLGVARSTIRLSKRLRMDFEAASSPKTRNLPPPTDNDLAPVRGGSLPSVKTKTPRSKLRGDLAVIFEASIALAG